MSNDQIIEILTNSLCQEFDIRALFLYGSVMYKCYTDIRDIDACIVIKKGTAITGRKDVYIPFNNSFKRASVYIIDENDLLLDIYKQQYGGRWEILFYHGFLCSKEHYTTCVHYYYMSMKAVIHQYELEFAFSPSDFYKINNITICKEFPFYIKSSLDFFKYEELRQLNYMLFKQFVGKYPFIDLSVEVNPFRFRDYMATEIFFRRNNNGTIRGLKKKLDDTISRVQESKDVIEEIYGEEEYRNLLTNMKAILHVTDGYKYEPVNFSNVNLKYYGKLYL